MKINIDRAIDAAREANSAYFDYAHASKVYYKKHGHGVNLDRIKTEEESRINWYRIMNDRASDALYMVCEVLDMSKAQRARLNTMARAFERWYNRTGWERLPSEDLLNRAHRFIAQEG